jgi:hypothetical protein
LINGKKMTDDLATAAEWGIAQPRSRGDGMQEPLKKARRVESA